MRGCRETLANLFLHLCRTALSRGCCSTSPYIYAFRRAGARLGRATLFSGDEHGKHHACPVCSALGALAGFAPPAPTALLDLFPVGLLTTHFVVQAERVGDPAGYRSRAPPSA
jgi:hypothetical protein